ncbi:MAG TPA: hypothetical protein VN879_13095, partial [Candidatus Acidoferrales bacterium]|nr:hypothetical protein [Candidatus Acidoferrales bacterium]
ALLSGYPPVGLLDAKRIEQTEEKRKQPYIPGLNAEALRLGRVSEVNEVNEVNEVKDVKEKKFVPRRRAGSG